MSSWWAKDATTDTKRIETGGPRKSANKIGKKGKIAKGHTGRLITRCYCSSNMASAGNVQPDMNSSATSGTVD